MLIHHFLPAPYKSVSWGIWIKEGKDQRVITKFKTACKEIITDYLYRACASKYKQNDGITFITGYKPSKLATVNICAIFTNSNRNPKLDTKKISRNVRLLLNTFENIAGITKTKVVATKTNLNEAALVIQADIKWAINFVSLSLLVNLIALSNSITQRKKDLSAITVTSTAQADNPFSKKEHIVLLKYINYYANNFDELSKKAHIKTHRLLDSTRGIVKYTNNNLTLKVLEKTNVKYRNY